MLTTMRRKISELIYPEGPRERRGLERRVLVDPLTGLGNRRALEMALPAAELDPNVSVVIFDLNNLGRANKVDGHKRGDELIRRAGKTLQIFTKKLTGQCRAFRFGGDEFVVLTDVAFAEELTGELRSWYGRKTLSDGTVVSLTGSCGPTFDRAEDRLQQEKARHKALELVGDEDEEDEYDEE